MFDHIAASRPPFGRTKGGARFASLAPLAVLFGVLPAILGSATAMAAPAHSSPTLEAYKKKLNHNTIALMAGGDANGAYTAFGADLKDMINRAKDKSGLRILPIMGDGAGTNVRDILYLRGIDMAILNTDVIEFLNDRPRYKNLSKRLRYITKLFNEEVHLLGGDKVNSIRDLDGKKVGFVNSSAEVTGSIILDKLDIEPALSIRISAGDGAAALKDGRLDALFRVTGKPANDMGRLKALFPGIRLVPIDFDQQLIGTYLPTQLTNRDYPGLIKKGSSVQTVATRTILAVFKWPKRSNRYQRLALFTKVFFNSFDKLRTSKNLHPKWNEVALEATVPGLERFEPASDWLKTREEAREMARQKQARAVQEHLMKNFKAFLADKSKQGDAGLAGANTEELFKDFLKWKKQAQ